MNAIVAVDKNWAIGKEGKLLVHLPGDLKYFQEKTTGKTIVVGRKTLESFPKGRPLPRRNNLVLSQNTDFSVPGARTYHSMESLEKALENMDDSQVYIAGGAQIYRAFLGRVDTVFVTKIAGDFQGDCHFPNLDRVEDFRLTWSGPPQEENGVKYQFVKYERKK